MTKLKRKSWSVRVLRWYQTLPRELHIMKPGTVRRKRIIEKWDKIMLKGKKWWNGDTESEP